MHLTTVMPQSPVKGPNKHGYVQLGIVESLQVLTQSALSKNEHNKCYHD